MPLHERMRTWLLILGPVWTTFIASVLLSLIAIQKGTLNHDGMLYVDAALAYQEGGLKAAIVIFNWPFLSILMAVTSKVSGLGLEASGFLLNILFMAGACALLVACSSRLFPEATWYICLVLLALPGFNDYRDEQLREYGCWFFVMLSIWFALRWSDSLRWPWALAAQLGLAIAFLFRPEALALFPAFFLWQWFASPKEERLLRLAMIISLPLVGLVLFVILIASDQVSSARLASDINRLALTQFNSNSQAIAEVLPPYARGHAATILFFGSLAIIPVKFIGKISLFLFPLIYSFVRQPIREVLSRNQVFAWAFLAHLFVLGAYVLEMQFLAGRYVAPLLMYSAPLAGYGYWLMTQNHPRWQGVMVLLALVFMLGNVVTFTPAKRHYVEAGRWLATNAAESERTFVGSPRAAYYAGWRYKKHKAASHDWQKLAAGLERGAYDLIVLESPRNTLDVEQWLECVRLELVVRFGQPKENSVIIARPVSGMTRGAVSHCGSLKERAGS